MQVGQLIEQVERLLAKNIASSRGNPGGVSLFRETRASEFEEILRDNFRERLEVAELAKSVGMSPSSFHKHFKSVTMTTPLQYQKDLRLTEARRILREGQESVSTAAFEVGYESPSQFSREYTRKFGTAPRVDQRVA